jgi:septum formation protein
MSFEIVPSNVDEAAQEKASPPVYVKKLARLKASAVAKKRDEGIIIGVDTIVVVDGSIVGKPKDKEDAAATLNALSGKVHKVVSGVCVINKYSGKIVTKSATTKVKFRELNKGVIDWYIGTGEPFGKAGSYAIQGKGALLVDWVKGDYYNVVGLPIVTLMGILEGMKVKFDD